MRILALIPARGGSKRLPGKNIRVLGGKPLIVWSIDVAKAIPDICDILVTTDAPEIAEVAAGAGALVPWHRPPELATDSAKSADVCLHALDWYESAKGKVDGLLLLQPTSPFRSCDSVSRGIKVFRENNYRTVIGVSRAETHPMWSYKIDGLTMHPFVEGGGVLLRSQELPPAYAINGAFYLLKPEDLRRRKSFFSDDMVPLVIEKPEEAIDIDTQWDWNVAEMVAGSISSI